MENIHEKLKYIEDNIEYIDIMDKCDFYFYRLSVKNRPVKGREVFTFLNPDNSLTAKNYFRMLIEDIVIGRTKQHIEEKENVNRATKGTGCIIRRGQKKRIWRITKYKKR